jgi:hypothetical protein
MLVASKGTVNVTVALPVAPLFFGNQKDITLEAAGCTNPPKCTWHTIVDNESDLA